MTKRQQTWDVREPVSVSFTVAGRAVECSFAAGEKADPTPDELLALEVLQRDGLADLKKPKAPAPAGAKED